MSHQFKGYKSGEKIGVDGSYDVNIWYSYDNDSKTTVINKKVTYNDVFNVKAKENANISNDADIMVRTLKQPTCTKVDIDDNGVINFVIEKELGVEIVGETMVKIAVEDDEEPWEVVEDDVTEETLYEIDKTVDENYIQ